MSFLIGKTKEMSPPDVQNLRTGIEGYINSTGIAGGLSGSGADVDLTPFHELFAKNRKLALRQAAEGAGNLTGSGFANTLGSAAGRSVADENAFLANLMMQRKDNAAQNFLRLIGYVPGLTGQQGYQPGALDYLFQGASSGAPLITALKSGGAAAAA